MKGTIALILLAPCAVLGLEAKESAETGLLEAGYEINNHGDRDPFVIWERVVVEEKGFDPSSLDKEERLAPRRLPTTADGAAALDEATDSLLRGEYQAAIESCANALKMLRSVMETEETVALRARAQRITRSAEGLQLRREREEEFAKLQIGISGIVWRPEGSFAIIDGRLYREGQLISPDLRLYRILPREVIFLYKHVKVSKGFWEKKEDKTAR